MIVVDAVLVAGFLFHTDDLHAAAVQLRKRDADWHGPELVLSEIRSVALKRHKAGDSLDAVALAADMVSRVVTLHRLEGVPVLHAAVEGGLWSYDAEYVALARQLKCRLVTTDSEILKNFPALAVRPERIA